MSYISLNSAQAPRLNNALFKLFFHDYCVQSSSANIVVLLSYILYQHLYIVPTVDLSLY